MENNRETNGQNCTVDQSSEKKSVMLKTFRLLIKIACLIIIGRRKKTK